MRESFVFHEDFICDLPDDYKADFMRYTIEYGLYGTLPPFMDGTLEMALWAKIARRIDADAEKYKEVSAKRKEAAQKRYRQSPQTAKPAREETPAENERQTEQKAETPEEKPAEPQTAKSEKAAAFAKPTVEEIRAYCEERKNGLDAQAFFDFYESKGWKVGAVKMRDWRACVRTWEQRRKTESSGGRIKAGTMWGKENEVPEEYLELM